MREKIVWQKSYDVHFESRQRFGAKSGIFVTKLRFTPRATTLAYGRGFPPTLHPTNGAVHVPPYDRLCCCRSCLPGCLCLWLVAPRAQKRKPPPDRPPKRVLLKSPAPPPAPPAF